MLAGQEKLVWGLLGPRAGDNAQVTALAARLPARIEFKQLTYNNLHHLPNVLRGASARSLTQEALRHLAPPWPDAVIAVGKRSAPAALWIKQNSEGRTKLIHLGRPRMALGAFDLVITTPQYGLPAAANVVEIIVPFTSGVHAPDAGQWRGAWRALPRPLIAVAVGAAKYPLRFGAREWRDFGRRLNVMALDCGGSLLLVGSPRTERGALDEIAAQVTAPHISYPAGGEKNPYGAALLEADRIVITSDSASMLADALTTGTRVDIFRLPSTPQWWAWSAHKGIGAALSRSGVLQPPRQTSKLIEAVLARGFACELGHDRKTAPFDANYNEAVSRVLGLLAKRSSQAGEA